jgi:uncharacterized membrane protein
MRRTLELVGLGMLAVLYWITWSAVSGPDRLPDRIPTHFNGAGIPNAWGPPSTLWLLPVIAAGVYLLITAIAAVPTTRVNLPVRVTAANLAYIQEQTRNMIGWIKVEMIGLFLYLQWTIIQAARDVQFRLSPLMIPVLLVCVFGTVGVYLVIIVNGAKARADSAL